MVERIAAMTFPDSHYEKPMETLWRASSLGRCLREQILNAKGVRFALMPEKQRMFRLRSAAHECYQDGLVHEFADVVTEKVLIDKGLRVSGHVDAILHKERPPLLVEIKTFNPWVFPRYVKAELKPYWSHQIDFYTTAAAEEYDGIVVQVHMLNIGDGKIHVQENPPREDYRPVAEALNLYWDNDILPPMADECKDCGIRHICNEPFDTISEWLAAVRAGGIAHDQA